MTYATINGYTIDPNNRLAAGTAEDWIGETEITEKQADAINAAIEDFAAADPSGRSDYEADRLNRAVRKVLS